MARRWTNHYARGDDGSWRDDYVSFYAASHPWEDFAESWAQVMHVHDVVSTGSAWGVVDAPGPTFDPERWVSTAVLATLAANELARAIGDARPLSVRPVARRQAQDRSGVASDTRRTVQLDPSPQVGHCGGAGSLRLTTTVRIGGQMSPETRGNTCVHAHG